MRLLRRTSLVVATLLLPNVSRAEKTGSREIAADAAAFKAVCGSCHATTLIQGLRSESEWLDVIEQMVKLGAKGTDDQFDRVIGVLLRTYTKVNINTATASEIAPVLDVSDATAQTIVKRREENGNFTKLDDLKKVPGVDPEILAARKDRIVF